MNSGKLNSRALTELYLGRIQQLDKNGPMVNSVIELNPDALDIADSMDKERKAGKVRGPLHGIPVLIKDNIDTGDKMMTTAGALAMTGNQAAQGCIHCSETPGSRCGGTWKNESKRVGDFRSSRSTSGWSSRGGQTKNPYVLEQEPLRFKFRFRRGSFFESLYDCDRYPNRRINRLSRIDQWCRRH